jgi:hypothetical protein
MRLRLPFSAATAAGLTAALACSPATGAATASPAQQTVVNRDAQIQQGFIERVNAYVKLRNGVADDAPPLPDRAEPEQLQAHRAAVLKGLAGARAGARPGDLFTPETQDLIRRLLRQSDKRQGSEVKKAIQEENPGTVKLRVNAEYPEELPRTTVPPQVLSTLPRLPDEDLEYRFVGRRLLLLDSRARMVVDYMDNALP